MSYVSCLYVALLMSYVSCTIRHCRSADIFWHHRRTVCCVWQESSTYYSHQNSHQTQDTVGRWSRCLSPPIPTVCSAPLSYHSARGFQSLNGVIVSNDNICTATNAAQRPGNCGRRRRPYLCFPSAYIIIVVVVVVIIIIIITIIIIIYLSLNREGRWGTTDDFATSFLHFSLFSTALWNLANSGPVNFLMLSSHLFFVCVVIPPCTELNWNLFDCCRSQDKEGVWNPLKCVPLYFLDAWKVTLNGGVIGALTTYKPNGLTREKMDDLPRMGIGSLTISMFPSWVYDGKTKVLYYLQ